MKTCFSFLAVLPASLLASLATASDYEVSISAKEDLTDVPVAVAIDLPDEIKIGDHVQLRLEDTSLIGQVTHAPLLAKDQGAAYLNIVVPNVPAGDHTLVVDVTKVETDRTMFRWQNEPGKHSVLYYGDRPVLDYMYEPVDDSSKERRMETYKVYHQVYDPSGTKIVTKGPGGLFPHHRGLFFGFNRISYGDGQVADTWHCRNGESIAHDATIATDVGAVLGRHRVSLGWHGQDGNVFARELREMTVYNVKGGNLIEFASRLTSEVGPIRLDGDPQHAGFQFRASQEVPDKTKHLTYYVRPDGKGKPGEYRNWAHDNDKSDSRQVNLAWNALSFVLGDQRYTCCYLDRPENPKEARFSERDYGRFGSYFEYDLDKGKDLELDYRIWLQDGEMSVEQVEARSNQFVDQPKITVKRLAR